jgi:hypothetical protein
MIIDKFAALATATVCTILSLPIRATAQSADDLRFLLRDRTI